MIISGWKVSGISEDIKIGFSKLLLLDLFKDISIGQENQSSPGKKNPNVNDRGLDNDYEEEFEWEEERNAFGVFNKKVKSPFKKIKISKMNSLSFLIVRES